MQTCEGDRLCALARAAVAAGVDAVVAAGGDGTVSAVAQALVDGEVPLAVLPLGTLNHFARDLGMPTDPSEAIRAIASGHADRVDVGEVNGRYFVNNSSLLLIVVASGLIAYALLMVINAREPVGVTVPVHNVMCSAGLGVLRPCPCG